MSYPGSKAQAGVFQRIIGQMPPHFCYVEPFFGSGQVFWRKALAADNVILDKDAGVIAKARAELERRAITNKVDSYAACAMEILEKHSQTWRPDTVIYCDPPYLLSTRQGRFYYDHEMREADHWRLLKTLRDQKCLVLLSGYPSELYSAALHEWRCIRYRTRTRGRTVTECLWCNFPEPELLHDWRYAGQTFRQRLGLKRLAARWLARLQAMPPRKRGYVLNAISQRQTERGGPANGD